MLEPGDLVGEVAGGAGAGAEAAVDGPVELGEHLDRDQIGAAGHAVELRAVADGDPRHVSAVSAVGRVGARSTRPRAEVGLLSVRAVAAVREAGLRDQLAGEHRVTGVRARVEHRHLSAAVDALRPGRRRLDQHRALSEQRRLRHVLLERDDERVRLDLRERGGGGLQGQEGNGLELAHDPVRCVGELGEDALLGTRDLRALARHRRGAGKLALGHRRDGEPDDHPHPSLGGRRRADPVRNGAGTGQRRARDQQ